LYLFDGCAALVQFAFQFFTTNGERGFIFSGIRFPVFPDGFAFVFQSLYRGLLLICLFFQPLNLCFAGFCFFLIETFVFQCSVILLCF